MRNRKLNRKRGYDYSQDGWYFFTTLIKDRTNWFGEIMDGKVRLNKFGKIVKECWYDLPNHYINCVLDEFIVMPNHVHGIICIDNTVGMKNKNHNLSEMVRAFKTFSSRRINEIVSDNDERFCWQKSFHDRIIRTDDELYYTRNYIKNNPISP